MLRNRIGTNLNMRAVEGSAAQTDFFKQRGMYVAYVNRITTGQEQVVNKTFVKIMDELGHNTELTYIKQDKSQPNNSACRRNSRRVYSPLWKRICHMEERVA